MVRVFQNPDTLLTSLADFTLLKGEEAIRRAGSFNIALSGGSSPKKLYELIASDAYRSSLDWTRVYFFFGDERFVPADHPDSNYRMAKESLFDPLGISSGHVFQIDTSSTPGDAAANYQHKLIAHFKTDKPIFDFILLGLGDDVHTASLFPHTDALKERTLLVTDNFIPKVNAFRITFTYPLINLGNTVAFLVYGESKANAVRTALEGPHDPDAHPAQGIKPKGELIWFLDEAAARNLAKRP